MNQRGDDCGGVLLLADDSRLRRFVLALCRSRSPAPPSDLVEDCVLEAQLTLWQLGTRLEGMSSERQQAYARTAIRHAVWRTLNRDASQRRDAVSLGGITTADGNVVELVGETSGVLWTGITLLEQVGYSRLASAVRALCPQDQAVLNLAFIDQLSDSEIGNQLAIRPEAAKKRRQRILKRLEQAIVRGGGAS
jgi:RNA polymerase sigma factor (sigma-70 family)